MPTFYYIKIQIIYYLQAIFSWIYIYIGSIVKSFKIITNNLYLVTKNKLFLRTTFLQKTLKFLTIFENVFPNTYYHPRFLSYAIMLILKTTLLRCCFLIRHRTNGAQWYIYNKKKLFDTLLQQITWLKYGECT